MQVTDLFKISSFIKRILTVAFLLSILSIDCLGQDTLVVIKDVLFLGNKRTKEKLIRRELSFKEGDTVNLSSFRESIEIDRRNIFNLRLFTEVKAEIHSGGEDQIFVIIKVAERWYWVAAPIFRLADRNFNEWWVNRNRDLNRVNYGVRFDHFNVRGLGERLNLKLQSGFTRNLSFGYSFPYINKAQSIGLKFGAGYRDRKNVAYTSDDHIQTFLSAEEILTKQTRAEIVINNRIGFYTTNEFIFQYRNNIASDTIVGLNPNFLGFRNGEPLRQQRFFNLGYVFRIDKRDAKNYPLRGYDFNTLILKRGIGIFDELDAFYVNSYIGKFTELGKGYYLSNAFRMLIGGPDDQAYIGYTSLGFGRSLVRGYELFVIEGSDFFLGKTDFKKKVFDKSFNLGSFMPIEQFRKVPLAIYAKTFFDFGYVQNFENYAGNDRLTNKLIYGIGLGVDLVTYYDFVLRLEYSYNAEQDNNFFVNFKSAL